MIQALDDAESASVGQSQNGLVADFTVLGEIEAVEKIAEGNGIRDLPRLLRSFGFGRWRKWKGDALVELSNGANRRVELHWCEAHGIGRVEMKIKRYQE